MTPCTAHRYFLPSPGLVFEASWPRRARAGRSWWSWLVAGITGHVGPEKFVSPSALADAVQLVEDQDVELATRAFTALGYVVTVRAHSLR